MKTALDAFKAEYNRIRLVYQKRAACIPSAYYSLFNRGNLFSVQERERRVLELLENERFDELGNKTILEIGCGTGYWLRDFIRWGARPENLTGIDLIQERVDEARHLLPVGVNILCGSAASLEFPTATFDLVLQSTVFSSILNRELRKTLAVEMIRLVKPSGIVLWYDYHRDNPRNPDARGVRKEEIYQLFPQCKVCLRRITVVPPITRFVAPYSWMTCHLLSKLSILRTHYLGVIKKS